jgi:hypothetical protein
LGRSKAVVAVARKLLISVWHVLTEGIADRYADPEKVAFSLFRFAYRVGVSNLPGDVSALQYTRNQLDRLEIGADLMQFSDGTRQPKLPRSRRAQGSPEAASRPAQPDASRYLSGSLICARLLSHEAAAATRSEAELLAVSTDARRYQA